MRHHALLAFVCSFASVSATGQSADLPGFPRLPSGPEPGSFAVADLDGDARLDVVIPSRSAGTLTVLRGDGWGDFAREDIDVASGFSLQLRDVAIGDVDGMFGLDIVTVGDGNALVALLDDGAGGWTLVSSAVVAIHDDLAAGDFNGDGRLDVVVCDGALPGTCWIYLGDGAGSFVLHDEFDTTWIVRATVADLNVDGFDDILLAERLLPGATSRLSVHLADGSGSFLASQTFSMSGSLGGVIATDVTDDGLPDVFAIGDEGAVLIFISDPITTLVAPVVVPDVVGPGESAVSLAFGDVDGDGVEDLFVAVRCDEFATASERTLRVLRGEGDGVFTPWTSTSFGMLGGDLEVADIDADGLLDVLLRTTQGVTWVRGSTDATFPAGHIRRTGDMDPRSFDLGDLDGDGDVDALVPHEYEDDFLVWHDNDGTGQLKWLEFLGSAMQFPLWVELGDVDADGDADVVVSGDLTQVILVEDGEVEYQPAMPSLGVIEIVDVDGDGRADLVGTGAVAVGDGTGAFTEVLSYGSSDAVDVADVDLDGSPDIVLVKGDESQVAVVYSQPTLETVAWDTIDDVETGVAGDFNEDGFIDVAVASHAGLVEVVFGDGQRGVLARQLIEIDGRPEDLSAVDINRDGLLDLVGVDAMFETGLVLLGVAGGLGDDERILTSQARFMEVADMTGNGHMDIVTAGGAASRIGTSPFVAAPPTSSVGGGIGAVHEPLLKLQGPLRANTAASLVVKNGPGNVSGFVVLGFDRLDAPFAGGVLVPTIDVLISGVDTSADGTWLASGTWPADVPSDTVFWLQAWFPDQGLASDGVEVIVP